jgi:hypothetical protein
MSQPHFDCKHVIMLLFSNSSFFDLFAILLFIKKIVLLNEEGDRKKEVRIKN